MAKLAQSNGEVRLIMSHFFLPESLVDSYGARFPSASELDHMMAIRGVLVRWVKSPKISLHAREQLSRAGDWVKEQVETYTGKEFKDIPLAPESLVDHYRDFVSQSLDWLYVIWTLLPLDSGN